jgi:signal transduction histidine kinase
VSHLDRGVFHNFTAQNGLAYNSIRSLLEDRDGSIWIGTEHGLSRYKAGKFIQDAMTAALSDEKVWALHQDADGSLWIGTRTHGLYRYSNGRLTHYTTANGLASDSIYCILEDRQGHFWFSGPAGVMLLNRAELDAQANGKEQLLSLRLFRASEGGNPAQFYGGTQPAGVLTKMGEAWFPTSRGLWSIRPDELEHPFISNLNIDTVTVDGRPAPLTGSLQLDAGSSRVEIAYEPVLLASQEGLRFRYMLHGYDRNWTYANAQQRQATYTNLPAGQYTFLVEAWETDQPGHTARASIDFIKRPYFYRTWWFFVACSLLIGLISFMAYHEKMRHVHERFNAVLAERTRLAREMHDTLIQGCVSVSAMLEAASSCALEDGESSQHLIDYANTQIRATTDEARQAVWNLRGSEQPNASLATTLQEMGERLSREYAVRVTFSLAGEAFSLGQQAAHEVMMVAREAFFNAILHADPSEIGSQLTFTPESLQMEISDDGKGFDPESVSSGHFGLQGMRERVEKLGGSLAIESGRQRGTRLCIRIPRAGISADRNSERKL